MSQAEKTLTQLAKKAGITINGDKPYDIQVKDERVYARILSKGSVGLGESYMDGWWECEQIDEMVTRFLRANLRDELLKNIPTVLLAVSSVIFNKVKPARAFQVGEEHYDVGNDLYQMMLDPRMTYTCGYWKNADNLNDAQEAKLDLVCRKLGIKEGDRILDIGSGWGSLLQFAAEKYGARGVGVTVSKEQVALAQKRANDAGLDIDYRLQDYRKLHGGASNNEKFDHIVSLGMFEHVGYKNYQDFFKIVKNNLKDGGLHLLQTIGNHQSVHQGDPWYDKYIFPNGMLPSIAQIGKAHENILIMEDWHNFRKSYDRTTMAWWQNVVDHMDELKASYDERFFRMWEFYLKVSAAIFRSGKIQLWQIVFSHDGLPEGYTSIR